MSPNCDLSPTPTKTDVWMMPLLFRQLADAVNKLLGLAKVSELKILSQVVLIDHFPSIQFAKKVSYLLTLEWRDAPTTRDTLAAC